MKRVAGLLPATLAAGYVLLATYPYGPGITSDSIHYLTAARHLMDKGTLTTYTGEPLVSYAPLLSVVYALFGLAGLNLLLTARLVSAFSFALVVWIAWRWLQEIRLSMGMIWVAVIMVLLARPLLWYAPYALSELPFIALTLCALWQTWRYVRDNKPTSLAVAGCCAALSALMRWIGVTTVATIGIFLLMASQGVWKKRFARAAAFVLVTLLPFMLWIARNRLTTGTFFGIREPSDYPWREMVFDTLWSLHRWFVPLAFENSVSLFAILMLVGLVSLAIPFWKSWGGSEVGIRRAIAVLTLYVGVYALLLMSTSRGAKFEALSERLWIPVAVPLAAGIILLGAILSVRSGVTTLARGMLAIVVIGWYTSGLAFGVQMMGKCFRDGPGVFNTLAWRCSETMQWLREHPLQGKVFSNFPEPLYYFTGIVGEHVPHKGPMRVASETHPRNLQQFLQKLQDEWQAGRSVYIVWFSNPTRSEYLYSLEELPKYLSLRVVKELEDGRVYQVEPGARFQASETEAEKQALRGRGATKNIEREGSL